MSENMSQAPLDADAVLRDDTLLDALGRGELPSEFDDDATVKLLHAWRNDIAHAAGLPEVEPSPVGMPALYAPAGGADTGTEPAGRLVVGRFRLSRRVLVAAAVGTIAVGSMGSVAAAGAAEPGSPLWPITKVVYSDRAESLEAREDALSLLREAKQAADHNRPEEAQRLLNTALEQADRVDGKKDKDKIEDQADEVRAELAAITEPTPTTTPAPPAQSPEPSSSPAAPPPNPAPTPEPTSPAEPPPSPADPSPTPPVEPSPTPSAEPSPTPSLSDQVGPTGLNTDAPQTP